MLIPGVTIRVMAPICYNNWYQSISLSQQLVLELKVDKGRYVEDRKFNDKV